MPDPDDTPDPSEWSDDLAATEVAPVEAVPEEFSDQVTRHNDLQPLIDDVRDKGFVRGFAAGQDDCLGALRSLMFEKGASNDEVRATVAHVRVRLTKP